MSHRFQFRHRVDCCQVGQIGVPRELNEVGMVGVHDVMRGAG